MNRGGSLRYTASVSNVGTSEEETSLTPPAGALGPPIRGKVRRVSVEKTAGPGTTVEVYVREGAAGPVRGAFGDPEDLDFDAHFDEPISYEVSSPSDLKIGVLTDDGTDSTDLDIEVEIEVP